VALALAIAASGQTGGDLYVVMPDPNANPVPPPGPVAAGDNTMYPLTARLYNPPQADYSGPVLGPYWQWWVVGVSYSTDGSSWGTPPASATYSASVTVNSPPPADTNTSAATLTASFSQAGFWLVTVEVDVSFTDSTGAVIIDATCTQDVVFSVVNPGLSVTASPTSVCAGAVSTTVHQSSLQVLWTDASGNPLSGQTVTLSTSDGSLSSTLLVTDSNGSASAILTSSQTASAPPDLSIATVTASGSGVSPASADVEFLAPQLGLTADPWELVPGESSTLQFQATFNGSPVPGHGVSWQIVSITDEYGNVVYSGQGSVPPGWGQLSQTQSQTGSDGTASAVYQRGQYNGTIVFAATDTSVFLGHQQGGQGGQGQQGSAQGSVTNKDEKVEITMDGVKDTDKQKVGGYVPLNANNDNGSKVDIRSRLPAKRDLEVNPIKNEKDLVQINLSVAGAMAGDTVKLSVTNTGRARIKVWDTPTKNNEVTLPQTWDAAKLPAKLYVEGFLEGKAEREIKLTLELIRKGTSITNDWLMITVTPVLQELKVELTKGCDPDLGQDNLLEVIDSRLPKKDPDATMTLRTKVIKGDRLKGDIWLVQTIQNKNWLAAGKGADVDGTKMTWDFGTVDAVDYAGKRLSDAAKTTQMPMYRNKAMWTTAGISRSVQAYDSPMLPLEIDMTSVLPAVGKKTTVDVSQEFDTYSAWLYDDDTIYYLGKVTWSVRYNGEVTQPKAGTYAYKKLANNKNNPSTGDPVLGPGAPAFMKPPVANYAKSHWR
jgi:hypothetical protein